MDSREKALELIKTVKENINSAENETWVANYLSRELERMALAGYNKGMVRELGTTPDFDNLQSLINY